MNGKLWVSEGCSPSPLSSAPSVRLLGCQTNVVEQERLVSELRVRSVDEDLAE